MIKKETYENYKITFLIQLSHLFSSCVVDDYSDDLPSYLGTWKLTKTYGTIAGMTTEFEPGLIKWTITADSIYVINNNTNPDLLDGFETGTYAYTFHEDLITTEDCYRWLSFGSGDQKCIGYGFDYLYLNENITDGVNYQFIR